MEYLPHGLAAYQNAAKVWGDDEILEYWDEKRQDIDWDAYNGFYG